MYHVEGILAVFPSLVGIHGDGQGRDRTDGLDHLLVVVTAQLHLEDVELVGTFLGLLANHVGRINADGEGRRRSLGLVQPPDLVPGCLQELAHQVVQGDVYGRLGRRVAFRQAVDVGQDVFYLEGVRKLAEAVLHFLQEGHHAVHRAQFLLQIRWHGGFAIADDAVILQLHLHVGRGAARVGSYREDVAQLQFVWEETQLHGSGRAALVDIEPRGMLPLACQRFVDDHTRTQCGKGRRLQKISSVLHRFISF